MDMDIFNNERFSIMDYTNANIAIWMLLKRRVLNNHTEVMFSYESDFYKDKQSHILHGARSQDLRFAKL